MSEEIDQIVNRVPNWITKWGITVISLLFLVFFILCWFIKYPDIVSSSVTITTNPPPTILFSRATGQISLVKYNNDEVMKGEVIAYIKSNVNFRDALVAEQLVFNTETFNSLDLTEVLELGELQYPFTKLMVATGELESFKTLDVLRTQQSLLERQKDSFFKLQNAFRSQFDLMQQEQVLKKEDFKRDSVLFVQKVLSRQAFNSSKAAFLEFLSRSKNLETSMANNEIQIASIQRQIVEIKFQIADRERQTLLNVQNARNEFKAALLKWKEQFLFTAPKNGTVVFLKFLNNDQTINQGAEVFSILTQTDKVFGLTEIPLSGSGKVKEGQTVNIKLLNFPSHEYGMLTGTIIDISKVPAEDKYLARINLADGLKTTYNKTLPFKQQLDGQTEIITEDIRILERIFYRLKSVASKI